MKLKKYKTALKFMQIRTSLKKVPLSTTIVKPRGSIKTIIKLDKCLKKRKDKRASRRQIKELLYW